MRFPRGADFMGCPENIAGLAAAPGLSAGLVLYITAQCGVLLAQDRWGPRFFLPSRVRARHCRAGTGRLG